MPIKILMAGDVMPSIDHPEIIITKGKEIFSNLSEYIEGADIAVANLEAPVISGIPTPIKKAGPSIYTSEATVSVLKQVGFTVLTLANNHFFDQGQKGVDDTVDACNKYGIYAVGGGKSYKQARKAAIIKCKDKSIAIINSCEHEFSIANERHGGSNLLDLISMQEDISAARKEADYVLLIIHGGVEHYQYPTPRMKRWYRHFIDLGADAVINHHQHCMNGYEIYKGRPIFYGLGNFYFPPLYGMQPSSWNKGYIVILTIDEGIGFEMIPYSQNADGIKLSDLDGFRKEIELLNIPISDDYLLQQKLDEYIIDKENEIKSSLLPSFMRKRFLFGLARRGLLGSIYKKRHVNAIMNTITCESHHEVMQRLFEIMSK